VRSGPSESLYEYHLSPVTSFWGDSLSWVFWGGVIAFAIHAVHVHQRARGWFWASRCSCSFTLPGSFSGHSMSSDWSRPKPNLRMHAARSQTFPSRCFGFLGCRIRSQRPFPMAVDDPFRYAGLHV
jgi:hypothetical protein